MNIEVLIKMKKFIDLSGNRYGRWLVISRGLNSHSGKVQYHCKCECGLESLVDAQALRDGVSRSCGCLRSERMLGNKLAVKEITASTNL